ncbi:MAG TPA: hypothetical protein VMG98_11685 [Verrucomicrobiae bacterium]|nr:hypothetical protein [Verrucomicrobiae bacterium]
MLETFGIVTTGATLAAVLTATLGARPDALKHRTVLAGLAGAWIGLVAALTASGYVKGLPVFGALFAVSLVAAPFVWRDVAPRTIVAINVLRVLGISFLLLAYAGQISGPFPYFAGIGDIITGLFALPTALRLSNKGIADPGVMTWNAFGLLDLVVAVALGVTTRPAAIGTLPWSLIPLVLVPVFVTGHIVLFARATAMRRAIA